MRRADDPVAPRLHATRSVAARGRDAATLVVDAGIEHVRLRQHGRDGSVLSDATVANRAGLREVIANQGLADQIAGGLRAIITGKLARAARAALGGGRVVQPAEALWLAARRLIGHLDSVTRLAFIDLSASGYLLVGVDREGRLVDDLLIVNPRCGAGSGINLDRVLQKLALTREQVDTVLAGYSDDASRERRGAVSTRADRCGVFASSATISDKNQGIPLDAALATTLKSEVLKACRKLPPGFDGVCLTGRIFHWRFARDCAEDYLVGRGVKLVTWDPENTHVLDALASLPTEDPGGREHDDARPACENDATAEARPRFLPAFADLRRRYEADGRYLREVDPPIALFSANELGTRTVLIGLDVGSTMAKAVWADAETGEPLALLTASNAGDTVETVKRLWREMAATGLETAQVGGIGITGSARYQVQQALARIYPQVANRLHVLVENYAHARGSIAEARRHVARLRARGIDVNPDLCVLVDIGGEDTKVSTLALERAELFANAMNLKCSAGTGSLMDTLASLFGIPDVAAACAAAAGAPRAVAINATCAVFLMENARRLQAEGVPRDEILASANWAIVENMARTLWAQIDIPKRAVVLLHGQTMLSDPLPLAVTDRLQSYLGAPAYALVPAHPGHRACLGLIRSMRQNAPAGATPVRLADFLNARFEKRIIECRGAACGDRAARCNRTSLACQDANGARFTFTLGGCTAVNELVGHRKSPALPPTRDAYREIWDAWAAAQPRSQAADRLVIPRSFCMTEWAYMLARVFGAFGIPVHVDDVRESDLLEAQTAVHIDACAPHMGAIGQLCRLAGEPHGIILVPQIESLPTDGRSLGHTCTVNQGGFAVACDLARLTWPAAVMHQFSLQLTALDSGALADQLAPQVSSVFARYGPVPTGEVLREAIDAALADHVAVRRGLADLAADLAEDALADGRPVAVVVGREYVLNPGLYDSSVRRLLRDKRMAAIPSYVLDIDLDPSFKHLYWRNPHAIVSILEAIAERTLHRRIRHARLAAIFKSIEGRESLLPVVQVSTFSCGPDSVTAPLIAEIMRQRPFLLLQSDAVLKELAHLENRVNTYVKQLDLGLHRELRFDNGHPVEVRRLHELGPLDPLHRARDVIYLPTLGDNRVVTAVLRAAGFTCIDNWGTGVALRDIVREGRKWTGDAVCTPLAAVYGDLVRAVEDFRKRTAAGDPLVAGKRRLLFFDNQGDGPCRQGQYAAVHALLSRSWTTPQSNADSLPGGAVLRILVGHERDGFNIGLEEWTLARAYQAIVLHGVLQEIFFAAGARCRDASEFAGMAADHETVKVELQARLEAFQGPGWMGRQAATIGRGWSPAGLVTKYFAYRMHGADLTPALARFSRRWIRGKSLPEDHLRIHVSGEVYMRVAQAEPVFGALLDILGFRGFEMTVSPLWAYLEYLPEWRVELIHEQASVTAARRRRLAPSTDDPETRRDPAIGVEERTRSARAAGRLVRDVIARPLYRAASLALPPAPRVLLEQARAVLPTLRPHGELGLYVGEAIQELRAGIDVFLSLAPSGCMVTTMGDVLTPAILEAAGPVRGRIQTLQSADGEIDRELLELALLRATGPGGVARRLTA